MANPNEQEYKEMIKQHYMKKLDEQLLNIQRITLELNKRKTKEEKDRFLEIPENNLKKAMEHVEKIKAEYLEKLNSTERSVNPRAMRPANVHVTMRGANPVVDAAGKFLGF
jgi:ribosome recycling factor